MKIKRVKVKNFLSWNNLDINIPERGLIGVFGRNKDDSLAISNGAGKSGLCESIIFSLWGKGLRDIDKGDFVRDEWSSICEFEINDNIMRVERDKRGASLIVDNKEYVKGVREVEKALEKILKIDYDTFRKVFYFEQGTVQRFTNATDANKKKLLENILGMNIFDRCYKEVVRMIEEKDKEIREIERDVISYKSRLEELVRQEKQSSKDSKEKEKEMKDKIKSLKIEEDKKEKELASIKLPKNTPLDIEIEIGKPCPICKRKIEKKHLDKWEKERDRYKELYNRYKDINNDLSSIRSHILSIKTALSYIKPSKKSNIDKDKIRDKIKEYEKKIKRIKDKIRVLEFWKKGFSSRGIKSYILSSYLPIIESKTIEYLSYLSSGTLRPEFKINNDRFEINIGGRNYNSRSSGERRRVDISVSLALRSIIRTENVSPVIYDEVFDALDESGIEQVMNILNKEAMDKVVFVITQRDELKELFDNRIVVEKREGVSYIG